MNNRPVQNYASGAMAWTLGSDTSDGPHLSGGCSTCRGLVEVDTSAGTYSLTIDFYIMAQFSRFVSSGAIALSTTGSYDYGSGSKVEAQAFVNSDGSRVLVIENGFDNDVYLTTTFNSGDEWSGNLVAQSVTTWTLPSN
jgi:O-glycosyl hydrolase